MLSFSGSISLDKLFTDFGRKISYNGELFPIKSVLERRHFFSGYPEMPLEFSPVSAFYDFVSVTKSTLYIQFFVIVTKAPEDYISRTGPVQYLDVISILYHIINS
jgi:hypothetical protein